MDIEYNTTRQQLLIPEYGRNIQKMVEYVLGIEDRETRSRLAKAIISLMAQFNPQLKEQGDFRHKLWDHLHIISDFKLDVDAPYPPPSREVLNTKPERINYAEKKFRYGHYGKYIEKIIVQTSELEDSPEKAELVKLIANHLKKAFLTWNRDSVNDEVIYEHLRELSHGKLILNEETRLHHTNDLLAKTVQKKKKFRPKDGQSHFKRRKK